MINRLKNNKIVKNAGWIIGCKLCKAVLVLITTMLISRHLGVANYGLLSYAAGLVAFVTPLMKLGIDNVLVHSYVTEPEAEGEIMGTTMVLNLISSVLCIIGVTAFAFLVNGNEQDTVLVCFLYSLMLIFQAMEMIYYWFHAKMLAKYSAIAMLVAYVIVAVAQWILVLLKANVYLFALSHSIDFLIIAVILFVAYKKKGGQKLSFSFRRSKTLLSVGRYYIVSGLMVTLFTHTDRIMLKMMLGNEATGIYAAASTCASMTAFVFAAITDSMRPNIFAGIKESQEMFEHRLTQLYTVIIYTSALQCIFTTIFAPWMIAIFYGKEYSAAVGVLQIAVWYTTFSYLGVVRNIWILAKQKQKYLPVINATGALANVVLNFVFIPIWGAGGAALASLLTQFFTNVVVGYIIPAIRPNNRLMIKALYPKEMLVTVQKNIFKR